MNTENTAVVVAWHNKNQLDRWLQSWRVEDWDPGNLILQKDKNRSGCAHTKNLGVRKAIKRGFETVVVIDDDCFSPWPETWESLRGKFPLDMLIERHLQALEPVDVSLFKPVTNPISRGTPYTEQKLKMPVAASMGFWTEVGDYDACAQLVRGARTPMVFDQDPIYGRYFPLCGMNIAFRPKDWLCENGKNYWWEFIEVPRFDDIWMGWLWQREAYRRGMCFNLAGPIVRHSRQSNVWQNLRDEAKHLERNETLWRDIATHPQGDYESLRKLLPV